jgi:hypothetical protein
MERKKKEQQEGAGAAGMLSVILKHGCRNNRAAKAKRACKIAAAVFLCHFMLGALNYIYADGDPWYRILWHHYYQDEGKIEQVCLGSSHVYCDINPSLLDAADGTYHFNMSSPGQCLNGSYYLLREAARGNRLSHVYLELYYICSVKDNFNGDIDPACNAANYSRNWQNTDYMRPSLNKLSYIRAIGGREDYPDILLPFARYRSSLDNWDFVRNTIEKKKQLPYKAYEHHADHGDGNGYDEYLGQGYFYSTREFLEEQRLFGQSIVLEERPMGSTSEAYIRRILAFCKKKGIQATLFISPIDDLQLVSTEGYDHYISQVRGIAEEYRVDFYDFNLAKEKYLPIQDGKYFRDVGHLNGAGADLFTPFFQKVVSGRKEDSESCFYASYEEKLSKMAPAVYGLYFRDLPVSEESPEPSRRYVIASNRAEGMEYRVSVKPAEGEEYTVLGFGEEKSFVLPQEQHGVCTVTCREPGRGGAVIQTLHINY